MPRRFLAALALAASLVLPAVASAYWTPAAGATWQYQLSGTIDTTVPAQIYSLDGQLTPAGTVALLHASGRKALCYFEVGGWEDYRPDAGAYPAAVLGANIDGWPGERWVDIRRIDLLSPVLVKRMQNCAAKGFDGVDPDLMDGYTNATGFPLTYADQLTFNRWVADTAHGLGMAASLKGDPEQAKDLAPWFQATVNEQCLQYSECGLLAAFRTAGKPILNVEYQGQIATLCTKGRTLGLSTIRKRLSLNAWRPAC